jgi:hypothetical protein
MQALGPEEMLAGIEKPVLKGDGSFRSAQDVGGAAIEAAHEASNLRGVGQGARQKNQRDLLRGPKDFLEHRAPGAIQHVSFVESQRKSVRQARTGQSSEGFVSTDNSIDIQDAVAPA